MYPFAVFSPQFGPFFIVTTDHGEPERFEL